LSRGRVGFVHPKAVPVQGLGVDTAAVTWLGRAALDAQRDEARRAGLVDPERAGDLITLEPGCVATAGALRAFLAVASRHDGDVVGVLDGPAGALWDHPSFGGAARMILLRGGGVAAPERLAAARSIAVPSGARASDVALLDRPGGRVGRVAVGEAVAIRIATWPGLLWANQLGLVPALVAALGGRAPWSALRFAWAALRAGSTEPERVGAVMVRRERGSRVHPSAIVEGSWLMEGARVEAGAIVRNSIVGRGAVVEPQALAIGVVLGSGARLQRRGFATYSLLDAGAVVGGAMQLGVIGPAAQVKIGAILLDQHLDGDVQVGDEGSRVAAPLGMIGAALGAGAMVGAGVAIAAGRLVPPGVRIAASAHAVVTRCSGATPGAWRVRDGGLEPC